MENVRGLLRYQQVYRQILISHPQTGWHVGHDVWSHHLLKNRFVKWLQLNLDLSRWWVEGRFQEDGLYEWMIMLFGLTNASSTFMRVMIQVLRPFMSKFSVSILMIFWFTVLWNIMWFISGKFVTHWGKNNYTQTLRSTCSWPIGVIFLRFVVWAQGISANPQKIQVIVEWSEPQNIREVKSFHGLATFYRQFIKGFNTIMTSITDCLKREEFQWSAIAAKTFKKNQTTNDRSTCHETSWFL